MSPCFPQNDNANLEQYNRSWYRARLFDNLSARGKYIAVFVAEEREQEEKGWRERLLGGGEDGERGGGAG